MRFQRTFIGATQSIYTDRLSQSQSRKAFTVEMLSSNVQFRAEFSIDKLLKNPPGFYTYRSTPQVQLFESDSFLNPVFQK